MKTRKITLFYKITQNEVHAPRDGSVIRKDEWIKEIQKTIQADWKPLIIKVTYEMYDPEVDKQRAFFNGPVIEYYAIQNDDLTEGEVTPERKKRYREQLLFDSLGYDIELVDRTEHGRKSTSDFKGVQQWHNFLETLRETHFESAGYTFPDSEEFIEDEKKWGHERAMGMAREKLRKKMRGMM